jgi:outer membrane protein TolC
MEHQFPIFAKHNGSNPILAALSRLPIERSCAHSAILYVLLLFESSALAQSAPVSPDHPWHGVGEQRIEAEGEDFRESSFSTDPAKSYSLAELIDLAETHNPETHFAWERARAQAAALGVARSELFPTLATTALSQTSRQETYLGARFYRQTFQDFQAALDLNYTVFDFGARTGRIDAAKAEVLAANFEFNDTHRRLIYQVEQAYYQLLDASGQEGAARASLSNAQSVQHSAEERLNNGLATLPDVLEARSATAQAEYELQAVLGAEEIAQGNLSTVLGTSPTAMIHVETLKDLLTPDSIGDSVDLAINRAFAQRPDLMQLVAEIRSSNARVKEARAAYYPSLSVNVNPVAQSVYGLQQTLSWGNTADLTGELSLNLNWTVFDGGARKSNVMQAEANVRAAEARANAARDEIANQVWAAYSNLNTAFRQRQAATTLLEAASKSYDSALESYNYGLRNLLDVTAAQRALAQARATDVHARTQVLTALANMAFRTGDSIQPAATRP